MESVTIDLQPFIGLLTTELLIPAILAGFLYLAKRFFNISEEQAKMLKESQHATALSSALENGADLVLARLGKEGSTSIEIGSPAVSQLVQYAIEHTPDAIAYFKGTNPDMSLQNLAASRLVKKNIQRTVVVPVKNGA